LKTIPERVQIESDLDKLLCEVIDEKHKKVRTLQKKLDKQRDSILTFLYYNEVPPDNNGSERAIRNVKVKQKISGFFKSSKGAQTFAINRSILFSALGHPKNISE
jgi:transposase